MLHRFTSVFCAIPNSHIKVLRFIEEFCVTPRVIITRTRNSKSWNDYENLMFWSQQLDKTSKTKPWFGDFPRTNLTPFSVHKNAVLIRRHFLHISCFVLARHRRRSKEGPSNDPLTYEEAFSDGPHLRWWSWRDKGERAHPTKEAPN